MRKTKLYISGPMTGKKDLNRPAFARAAKKLIKAGYDVVSPPDLDKDEHRNSWEGCLRRDIKYLMDCDGVALLAGWAGSRGATLEVHIADALSMDTLMVNEWIV